MHLPTLEDPKLEDPETIPFWHAHTFFIPSLSTGTRAGTAKNVLASLDPLKGPRFRTQFHNVSFGWRLGISEGTLGDETLDVSLTPQTPYSSMEGDQEQPHLEPASASGVPTVGFTGAGGSGNFSGSGNSGGASSPGFGDSAGDSPGFEEEDDTFEGGYGRASGGASGRFGGASGRFGAATSGFGGGFGDATDGGGLSATGFGGGFPTKPSDNKHPPVPPKASKKTNGAREVTTGNKRVAPFRKRESSVVEEDSHRKAVIVSIECVDGIVCVGNSARVSIFVRHPITKEIMHPRTNLRLTVDPRLASCRCNEETCICHITNHKRIALDADLCTLLREGLVTLGRVEVVVILYIPRSAFSPLEAFHSLPPPDLNSLVIHLWNDVILDKETTDTNLCSKEGTRLRCHRTVLAYKSPVFEQLFGQPPPKIEPRTPILVHEERAEKRKPGNKPALIIKRRAPSGPQADVADETDADHKSESPLPMAHRTPSHKRKPKLLFCWKRKQKIPVVSVQPEDPKMTAWKREQTIAGPGGTLKLRYSAEAIMEMLKFAYAQSHSPKFIDSNEGLVTEVLRLAYHYEMRGLVGRCERQLVVLAESNIDIAPRMLSLSQIFHLGVLQNVSASSILRHYGCRDKGKDDETWKRLKDDLRKLLLQYSTETTRTNLMLETGEGKQKDPNGIAF